MDDPELAVACLNEKAWLAKNRHDTAECMADIREALKRNPDPGQLWISVKVAGANIGEVMAEVRAEAEKYPYSWRARIIRTFLDGMEGKSFGADAAASDLYREDPLTYDSKVFELVESMLNEGLQAGRVSQLDYQDQVQFYFLNLLGMVPKFGYDADLWSQFESYGLTNERNAQLEKLVAKYLPFKPENTPKALRPMFMFLALNWGDSDTVRRLYQSSFEPGERDDPTWLYAADLAVHGHEAEALRLTANLSPASDQLEPRMEAMRTYLLAKTGKRKEALERLKTEVDDLVVRGFDGLAWVALGNWAKAEPLLKEQGNSRNWAFLFVSGYCTDVLDQHLRKAGRLNEARMLALYAAASQPGNPIFDKFTFVEKPGLPQFAGKYKDDCVALDDRVLDQAMLSEGKKTFIFGTLSFQMDAKGNLKGAFTEENGVPHPFSGKIDALGNVKASAMWRDKRCEMRGKVAPPSLYKTFAGFKQYGQELQLIDEDGFRIQLVGLPEK